MKSASNFGASSLRFDALIAAALVAACYTLQDLRDAECNTACLREGYRVGLYQSQGQRCLCGDFYDHERVTKRRASLLPAMRRSPIRVSRLPEPEPVPTPTFSLGD